MADALNASIERSIHEAEQLIAALEEAKDKRSMEKAKEILARLNQAVNEAHTAMHPQSLPSVSRVALYKKIKRFRG